MENRNNNGEEHVSSGQSSGGSPYVPSDDPRQKYIVNGFDPLKDDTDYSSYKYGYKNREIAEKIEGRKQLRIIIILFSIFFLIIIFPFIIMNCAIFKSPETIEKELERKFGMDFTFVNENSQGYGPYGGEDGSMYFSHTSIRYYYYKDCYGNELVVKCEKEKLTDFKKKYTDYYNYDNNVNNPYVRILRREYISRLEESGIEFSMAGDLILIRYIKINNYSELDNILNAVDEANEWLNNKLEIYNSSYIKSKDNPKLNSEEIEYCYFGENDLIVNVGNNHMDSEDVIKEYRKLVREGKINDSIPDD